MTRGMRLRAAASVELARRERFEDALARLGMRGACASEEHAPADAEAAAERAAQRHFLLNYGGAERPERWPWMPPETWTPAAHRLWPREFKRATRAAVMCLCSPLGPLAALDSCARGAVAELVVAASARGADLSALAAEKCRVSTKRVWREYVSRLFAPICRTVCTLRISNRALNDALAAQAQKPEQPR